MELGGEEGKNAAATLAELCEALREAGAKTAAARVTDVDEAVGALSFPVIERLLAPERILAELDDAKQEPVRRLHSLRNQVALLPLILTWLSIALVALVRDSGALVPVFAVVAIVDAGLIGWVVWLTRQTHAAEETAAGEYEALAVGVDVAVRSLALAMQTRATLEPANAQEWAVAAREVLTDTRQQTDKLFEKTVAAVEKADENLATVHAKTAEMITMLAGQTGKALDSLQQANEQMVASVAKEAISVLNSAVVEDRALVGEQLAPLVEQFQANVESFGRSYDTYQENTAAFVAVTSDVGVATTALGESAKLHSEIAGSIDTHLRNIDGSQQNFIAQVTDSARNMGTAAAAMETMSTLLSDRLRGDLESITRQLNDSSARLTSVDTNLERTTEALGQAAMVMRDAARAMAEAGPRRWQPFGFGKKSHAPDA